MVRGRIGVIGWACSGLICATVDRCARANDLLVSSRFTSSVLRYDGQSGAFKSVFASGSGMANPNGIAYGPDGYLYVGNGDEGKVLRYDGQTGAFVDEFVTGGAGGLLGCRAIAFGPNNDLYVDNGAGNNVLRYDGHDGHFVGVAAAGHGLQGPVGLVFGPGGDLFVGAALSNRIYEFDLNGVLMRLYAGPVNQSNVTGVVFDGQGRLYAAYSVSNAVVRFSTSTGQSLGVFASGAGLNTPIGMIFDPDGDLIVGSFGTDSAILYSGATGKSVGMFIAPGSGGLDGTHNFAYMPVPGPAGLAVLLGVAWARRHRTVAGLTPFTNLRNPRISRRWT